MKLAISVITAVSLRLASAVLGNDYSDLAAKGYRWVTIDGPYACTTEEDARRIAIHRTDELELYMVENILCYYLIPGAIVKVIKEDRARGMSEIWLGNIRTPLWTYTRFLNKVPVHDTYGVIETPDNSGLIPSGDAAIVLPISADGSTAGPRQNGNP